MSWRAGIAVAGALVVYAAARHFSLLHLGLLLALLGLAALEVGALLKALLRRRVTRAAWRVRALQLRTAATVLLAVIRPLRTGYALPERADATEPSVATRRNAHGVIPGWS